MTKAMMSGRWPDQAARREAERADHHLHADKLERDIRHGRQDARERHGEREEPAVETLAHVIGGRHMAALARNRPQPREDQIEDRVDHDRIGHGKEAHGPCPEDQSRHGNERVGRVEIAAEQEPGDHGPEAAAAEPPFMQQVEVGLAPARRDEPHPGDEQEQRHEDGRCGEIEAQRISPGVPEELSSAAARSVVRVTHSSSQ